jgi:hypothetical protein
VLKKIEEKIYKYKSLLIRIDDIAPNMNWQVMNKVDKLLSKKNIKPILGVIPNNKDKELLKNKINKRFWRRVNRWQKKGWEICMHGYDHIYINGKNKNNFFSYNGDTEFAGLSYLKQDKKIKEGLNIFRRNKIKIRCFFAPNHTYDLNTFKALKKNKIFEIIDGYGLFPYIKFGIKFIPQLFYNNITLPYGINCTQIHLNNWTRDDYNKFSAFINKNHTSIISYDEALNKIKNSFLSKTVNFLIKTLLINLRKIIRIFKFSVKKN